MKNLVIPCLVAFATSLATAAPADDVSAAAKKLAGAPSYAWTRTTENAGGGGRGGGFGGGPQSGVTEKDGYTVITRTTPNGEMKTVAKGEKLVRQNPEGTWMTNEELAAQFGGGGGRGGRGGRGGFGGAFGAAQNPAEEISALVGQAKDYKMADGAIIGTLTEEALTQRLSFGRGGQAPAAPKNASGTVRFWLKDGAISKYEVHAKGTVTGRGGEIERDTKTTTEIKDVGTAKATVPEDAKKKLGA